MNGEHVEHTQLICGEAYAIVEGFLCELERVCEPHEDEELDQWDYC